MCQRIRPPDTPVGTEGKMCQRIRPCDTKRRECVSGYVPLTHCGYVPLTHFCAKITRMAVFGFSVALDLFQIPEICYDNTNMSFHWGGPSGCQVSEEPVR